MLEIEREKLKKQIEVLKGEIPEKQYNRILMCVNDEIMKQEGEIRKKFSCNSRYCPICSNKLKVKEQRKMRKKLEEAEEKNYLIMTLNGNNVTENNLKYEIEDNINEVGPIQKHCNWLYKGC